MNEVNRIKEIFVQTPENLAEIREILSSREFTKKELAELGAAFTWEGFNEYYDALNPECPEVSIDHMHSDYILDAIQLLLEFGLDPNLVVDEESAFWHAMYIDAPNVGASLMRLLLENGADPNLPTISAGESIFDYIDFKVSFDEYTHDYFYTVQCWLVLMAYGGQFRKNGKIPITMLNGHSVEIFKNFELFDYTIEPLPQEPGKYGCWIMHIYNIETKEEVARYG